MLLKCGFVGLPNAGKSSLLNAIANETSAQVANYPFCTIEPNVASVVVPDKKLDELAKIGNSQRTVYTTIDMVDIAGLVKGASKGEGLGNQFLENIRQVSAVIHVIRCFENENILHVENSVDPVRDLEIIETELLLSDLSILERLVQNLQKKVNGKDEIAIAEYSVATKLLECASRGDLLQSCELDDAEEKIAQKFRLVTNKPSMYVANISGESSKDTIHLQNIINFIKKRNPKAIVLPICIETEAQLAGFEEEEKIAFLKDSGIDDTALAKLAQAGKSLLDLTTFYTVGETEARAWNVRSGAFAPQAAGVIHTDFERGFIKAETISYEDFVKFQGSMGAKENGRLRIEGKEYLIQEGDIFNFRFNV